jgi:hypothetical protein
MSTAADFVVIGTLCITKRAHDQIERVAAATGRTFASLCEAAVEDAALQSEREYPPPANPTGE